MAKIEVFRSRNTTGLAINGRRVTSVKPYGLIQTIQKFDVDDSEILEAIETDVQLVKHGSWLSHHAIWIDQPKFEGWFVQAKCSECEKWAHVMNPYTKDVDYKRCPHCGARMDGDIE